MCNKFISVIIQILPFVKTLLLKYDKRQNSIRQNRIYYQDQAMDKLEILHCLTATTKKTKNPQNYIKLAKDTISMYEHAKYECETNELYDCEDFEILLSEYLKITNTIPNISAEQIESLKINIRQVCEFLIKTLHSKNLRKKKHH